MRINSRNSAFTYGGLNVGMRTHKYPDLHYLTPEERASVNLCAWDTVIESGYSLGNTAVIVKHAQVIPDYSCLGDFRDVTGLAAGAQKRLFFWHSHYKREECSVCSGAGFAQEYSDHEDRVVSSFGIPPMIMENSNLTGIGGPQYVQHRADFYEPAPLLPKHEYQAVTKVGPTPQVTYDLNYVKYIGDDRKGGDEAVLEEMLAQVSDNVTGASGALLDEMSTADQPVKTRGMKALHTKLGKKDAGFVLAFFSALIVILILLL